MSGESWIVEPDPVFGCLLWTGKTNDQGRPILWRGNKPLSAIREAFALALAKGVE